MVVVAVWHQKSVIVSPSRYAQYLGIDREEGQRQSQMNVPVEVMLLGMGHALERKLGGSDILGARHIEIGFSGDRKKKLAVEWRLRRGKGWESSVWRAQLYQLCVVRHNFSRRAPEPGSCRSPAWLLPATDPPPLPIKNDTSFQYCLLLAYTQLFHLHRLPAGAPAERSSNFYSW